MPLRRRVRRRARHVRYNARARRQLAKGRETVTTVGRPYAGPSGGRVVPPSEAPRSASKSTCLKGKRVKFLILGTRRADHITGSDRPDVIFGLGGKDKISGGRGNDCIVGGKGNDAINVATAGPAAKVDCGKGKDTVSYNHNE